MSRIQNGVKASKFNQDIIGPDKEIVFAYFNYFLTH